MLAGLTSSLNVSLFSRSLKSSCGQASIAPSLAVLLSGVTSVGGLKKQEAHQLERNEQVMPFRFKVVDELDLEA